MLLGTILGAGVVGGLLVGMISVAIRSIRVWCELERAAGRARQRRR